MKYRVLSLIVSAVTLMSAPSFKVGVTYNTNDNTVSQSGLILNSASGSYTNADINGVINVKGASSGVTGLGVADDTTALQVRANLAKNKKLVFTAGDYKFSDLALPDGCEVVFEGGVNLISASPGVVSYWFTVTSKTNVTIHGKVNANGNAEVTGLVHFISSPNCSVYDVTVYNLATNTFSLGGGAISGVSSPRLYVNNCTIDGAGYGIALDGCDRSIITGNKIKNTYRDGILGYDYSNNSTFMANVIERYSSGLQSGRGGIQVYGSYNTTVSGNIILDAYSGNPQDTGGIRFRDAANFSCVGNMVTNAPSGILCNQASDFPGITTFGAITGNSIDRCVFSDIHVAGNCGYVGVHDNITANANTAASASVASITIASPYAAISGNIISNNIGNAWGIYGGSTGLLINDNNLINVGNGGSSVPQIAAFGTNIAVYNNHFKDDRATSIGYLGIKIYTNCSASIGYNFYGNGITNFIEVNSNATYFANSAPFLNRFATTPTTGTFPAGTLSKGSGGRMFRSNGSGWSEDVFMDSIYANNSSLNFYAADGTTSVGVLSLTSGNNTVLTTPAAGGSLILNSTAAKVQIQTSGGYWYLYPNGDMRSGVIAAPTYTTSSSEGGLLRTTNINGKVMLVATWPTLPYSVLATEGVGNPISTNDYGSTWTTNYQQSASQSNIWKKIETIVAGAAGTNQSVLVNGSLVQGPNFTNSATSHYYVGALTNIYAESALVVNVSDPTYGATGNGTTDDLTALQAAVNAGARKTVIFSPASTYKITGNLYVTNSNTTIDFNGATLSAVGNFRALVVAGVSNIVLKNFSITNSSGGANQTPIHITNSVSVAVENGLISLPVLNGIEIYSSTNVTFRNMYVDTPTAFGALVYNSSDFAFTDCTFYKPGSFSVEAKSSKRGTFTRVRIIQPQAEYGFYCWTGLGTSPELPGPKLCEDITFEDCYVQGGASSKHLLYINAARKIKVRGGVLITDAAAIWAPVSIGGNFFYAETTITGNTSASSPTVSSVSGIASLVIGDRIHIAGVTGNFTISNIVGTTVTLDGNADATLTGAIIGFVAKPTDVLIDGLRIVGTGTTAVDNIDIGGTVGDPLERIVINNLISEGAGAYAVNASYADVTMSGGTLKNQARGLNLTTGAYLTSSGITITNQTTNGLYGAVVQNGAKLSLHNPTMDTFLTAGVVGITNGDIVNIVGGEIRNAQQNAIIINDNSTIVGTTVINSRNGVGSFGPHIKVFGTNSFVSALGDPGTSTWLDSVVTEGTGASANIYSIRHKTAFANPIILAGSSTSIRLNPTDTRFNTVTVTGLTNTSIITGIVGTDANGKEKKATLSGLTWDGSTLTATTGGGGSAPVGTMVNSGASVVGSIPGAADLTGTNLIPSKITAIGTNLLTGTLGVTNRATFNGEVLIPGMPTLTIATDTIDVTGYSKALIETEAAASSDNLSTINGGVAGKLFWFLNTLNSRTITWKHNVGNIITSSSADFTTSSGELVVGLYLEGHNKWYIWPTKALAQIGTIALTQGGTGQTTAPAAFDALSQAAEVSIASASTVNIGAAASARILITGTTGITAFDTVAAGTLRFIRFNGILTITHNSTSMILPNATSNITTASGDTCIAISLGSGNWRIYAYQKANGQALVDNTGGAGGTVGTVINTGTPLDLAVPTYTGTTGTNIIPSKVTINALTNIAAGTGTFTNGVSMGDPATTNFATITFAYGANYTNASTANGITNNIPVVFNSNVVVNATLNATTLQQGGVGVVTTARTVTIAGTANEITSSAGAQDLSANRTWTLSLPATVDLTSKTAFLLPSSAAPTTDSFAKIAGDNNFWAASHGALQYFDGTSNMVIVATAITSIPSDGQVPTWDNTLKVWKAVTPTTGGAIVGTMLNVGASLANAVPIYNDTTGTNIVPAKVTIGSLTNLLTGGLVVSNSAAQITVNGQVFTYPAGPDTLVGNTNAATLQNKTTTTTSAGGNNTITARRYLPLKFEKVALTSMIPNTNDFSTAGYGRVRFTGNSTATNSNFMVYRAIVPPRFVGGSGQDLTMEYMSVKTSGTQTGAITFNIGLRDTTDSAAADATDATSFNTYVALTSAALSTPAASDRFSIANKTLTGWRSALTAGHDVEICIARNDTNTDTMDVIDMLISYVETQ